MLHLADLVVDLGSKCLYQGGGLLAIAQSDYGKLRSVILRSCDYL
jgi:hypothetical protein